MPGDRRRVAVYSYTEPTVSDLEHAAPQVGKGIIFAAAA